MITALLLAVAIDSVFFANPVVTGRLERGIEEASGLVASKQLPGLLWTHNDSGDGPVVYGIDTMGRRLCAYELNTDPEFLPGSDWEDIAYGWHVEPTDTTYYVFVGDIGDNNGKRDFINIYRMCETRSMKCAPSKAPMPPSAALAKRRAFVYPDGPRDAETLLFDPMTEDLYILSKRDVRNRLYRVPRVITKENQEGPDTLDFVMELPLFSATGGDISSDGREILIKTYTHVYRWTRAIDEPLQTALARTPSVVKNYVPEPQGEAICFNASGAGFYTVSESGTNDASSPLYYYSRTHIEPEQNLSISASKKKPSEYTINYRLANQTPVILTVHNELMMTVKLLVDTDETAGVHKHTIDMAAANPGTYVVVLRHGAFYEAVPFTTSAKVAVSDRPGQKPKSTATSKRKKQKQSQK